MAESNVQSPITTPEQFEELALTDINKWLEIFLIQAKMMDDGEKVTVLAENEDGEYADISDVDEWREYGTYEKTVLGLYIEEIEQVGGEHDGQDLEVVFAIMKDEDDVLAYFRASGCYCSYSGNEYNERVELVEARQVMVTKWFALDGSDDTKGMK